MQDFARLTYLLQQAHKLHATTEEYAELLSMIEGDETGEVIDRMNAFHQEALVTSVDYDSTDWEHTLKAILHADKVPEYVTPVRRIMPWRWVAAAAAVVLLAGAGRWLLQPRTKAPHQTIQVVNAVRDITPGGNKAVLVLGDGSQISLDSAANGTLAQQGSARVTKSANGQLQYANTGDNSTASSWNTLKTPMGGQYKLSLADGTIVWLNAGSSITYPTSFNGSDRSVTVTGETYFEVAPQPGKPFRVKAAGTQIEVLGTHFNVNAYDDEATINTTLLKGAVKVIAGRHERVLTPGQQASVAQGNAGIEVHNNINTAASIAWKEGFFSFDNADIQTVMRQLSRWYNIEVKYEGDIPKRAFTGEIGRSLTLSQVLKGLSKTRINYRIENGNRIVILP